MPLSALVRCAQPHQCSTGKAPTKGTLFTTHVVHYYQQGSNWWARHTVFERPLDTFWTNGHHFFLQSFDVREAGLGKSTESPPPDYTAALRRVDEHTGPTETLYVRADILMDVDGRRLFDPSESPQDFGFTRPVIDVPLTNPLAGISFSSPESPAIANPYLLHEMLLRSCWTIVYDFTADSAAGSKFWRMTIKEGVDSNGGATLTRQWGKIGSKGQSTSTWRASRSKLATFAANLIKEKLASGYRLTGLKRINSDGMPVIELDTTKQLVQMLPKSGRSLIRE